jgi:hypothetical protein
MLDLRPVAMVRVAAGVSGGCASSPLTFRHQPKLAGLARNVIDAAVG